MVPDYYAMLGVDPKADQAALAAALAKCQPAWSSGTRNPKNKHLYQSYLDQIPAIRQTLLGDPSIRAAYDAELAAARRADRDRKLDELQRLVKFRAAKGGLTAGDRTLLRAEAVKLGLTAADLDRLAQPIPDRAEAPAEVDEPDPPADVIDPAMRRQVRVALQHLHRRDLYDVLEVNRDAPGTEIAIRADAERQRWMQKTQVTAEKTAWLEAVSYAQSHLTNPESRARYDRTLALEAEESLIAAIEFTLDGLTRLDPATRAALIDEAAASGIAPDRAERLIGRVCRAKGVAQEGGGSATTTSGASRLLRCRSCNGVTEFARVAKQGDSAVCRHCGASLHWDCPVCQRTRWVDEPRCACGFRLELREPLIQHFEAAQHAHKARDFATALAHLHRVQDFAPRHVGARKGVEKIKERLAEIDRAQSACETEKDRRHLVAARVAAEAWGRLVDPTTSELRAALAEIGKGLRQAQTLAAQAKALMATDPSKARALFKQSLSLAADLPEARDGLRRCPPDPPADLRAEYVTDRLRLRWTPPAPDGLGPLSFRVVRKPNGVPAHAADGVIVAEVDGAEAEDAGVSPGETVGYGVFSRRNEIDSPTGANVGPTLILGEVANVRVEAQSQEVHLSWSPPKGAIGVRVVRKRGSAPDGPDDGERVESLRDHAQDLGLQDDRVYHYGIFAIYRAPDGKHRASRGVFVSAMPHPQVEGVDELTVQADPDGRLRLSWRPPARGLVKVIRTAKPPSVASGDRLTLAEAEALGGQWLEETAADHTFDPRPPAAGVCHYTPLTAWAGTLTVGKGTVYSCVPDPSDLRAVRAGSGGRVHLRWRWSPQGSQSLVVCKAGSSPLGPDDPDATVATVNEVEYSRQGYYSLSLPAQDRGPWHVHIYSVAMVEGTRVVSPGLDPTARTVVPGPHPEVTVSYVLRRPTFPGRPWSVTFRTEPAGSPIPPTALVAHPRTVPLSVDDGELVDQFPASQDGATFRIRPGINLADHRARIFADPLSDPNGVPPIRLRHPEAGGTRV